MSSSLISQYVAHVRELDGYLSGTPLTLTGSDLSLAQITAIARHLPSSVSPCAPSIRLSASEHLRAAHDASRHVIASKVEAGLSIYGVSTGFGGSADTRTDDPVSLGAALLQHQHAGVVTPSSVSQSYASPYAPLPLTDPTHSTTMPPAWTRAAMLVRANSLLRGHSGVRWELVEKMIEVLQKGIVPLVPLRGSISSSGDLSSLSYIAGMLIGNPAIRVWLLGSATSSSFHVQNLKGPTPQLFTGALSAFPSGVATPATDSSGASPSSPSTPASSVAGDEFVKAPFSHQPAFHSALSPSSTTYTASKALALTSTSPLPLASKEHLGILNGTAFSAGLSALVVNGAKDVVVLGAALTALSIEAMLGARGSFDPFVGHARPHPGQIEAAHLVWSLLSESKFAQGDEVEVKIEEDQGVLRQDRYSLRTAPQWLGPQFEDLKRVEQTIRIEVNSTTDNPLVEPPRGASEGKIHHAGNFQALSVTNAMDHLRLSLSHIGRLMFVQLTEMINPAMNRGLPGNLSGGEGALDFGCKGVDIAAASYAGELNALGGMNVGVGNVSAEIHNQSVNSLALISTRYTLSALEVTQLMAASHLFVVCQALDSRALYVELRQLSAQVLRDVVREVFALSSEDASVDKIARKVIPQMYDALDRTTSIDTVPRMAKVASEAVSPLLEALSGLDLSAALDLGKFAVFRTTLADKLAALLTELRCAYLGVSLADVRRGCMGSATVPAPTPVFDIAPRGRTPASTFLAPRTRVLYEFVREELGIGMHGADNLRGSVFGMRDGVMPGFDGEDVTASLGGPVDVTVGDKVAIIVEAIRDGRMARALVQSCAGISV